MKFTTKKDVSNQVFGAEMPYGRIIEFQTELDTQGTDENLRGVMSPKLEWAKRWEQLPLGLREYEEQRANKAMTINVRLGQAEVFAQREEIEHKITTVREHYEALMDSARIEFKEKLELKHEMWRKIIDIVRGSKGCLRDFPDDEDPIHPNFITFTPGDEQYVMDEEGVTLFKGRSEEEQPEKQDRTIPRLDSKNWLHTRTFEKNRRELYAWFVARMDLIYSLWRNKAITKRTATRRVSRLLELVSNRRDESFDQRLLDSIEKPPSKDFPQFRKRDHYLTAGGRVKSGTTREQLIKQFGEHSKWVQLYTIFVESRKLNSEQYLELKANLEFLLEQIREGKPWEYVPMPKEVKEPTPVKVSDEEVEREMILQAFDKIEDKLVYYRQLHKDSKRAKDHEMQAWAFEQGSHWRKVYDTYVKQHNITKVEIANR